MPYFSISGCNWDWVLSLGNQDPETGRYLPEVTQQMRDGAENRNSEVGHLFCLCPRSVASGTEAGLGDPP